MTRQDDQSLAYRIYDLATGDDDARLCRDIPEDQCHEQPRNFVLMTAAQACSKIGDTLADPKIVLPWFMGVIGAPVYLTALLVPIRESLALLPQVLIGGMLRRFPVRKGFWTLSSIVEGACIAAMAGLALSGLSGTAAGWGVVGLLTVFSLARGVASVASKDTLGKTVSKTRRGRVSGYAAMLSGIVASGVGLYLVASPDAARPEWLLHALLITAGMAWLAGAGLFWLVAEKPGATDGGRGIGDLARDQVALLFDDRELQKFLVARALMISTALAGPLYVTLAQRSIGGALDGLGWLVLASGLAATVSSAVWGSLSDHSSRLAMAIAAGVAGALGIAVLAILHLMPDITDIPAYHGGVLFVLGIAHAGVRIARKTHVVDLADGDRKSEYVAVSNTIIGVLLLGIGGVTGALVAAGLEYAIAVLAGLSLTGAAMALTLRDVQA